MSRIAKEHRSRESKGNPAIRFRNWAVESPSRARNTMLLIVATLLVLGYMGNYGMKYLTYQRDVAAFEQAKVDRAEGRQAEDQPYITQPKPRPSKTSASAPGQSTPTPAQGQTPVDDLPVGEDDYPTVPDALEATTKAFVTAWLSAAAIPHEQWVADVAAHTSVELIPFLDATPATAVPATTTTKVTADYSATTPTGGSATADLGDGSSMAVVVALTDKGWKVVDYRLEER